MAELIRQATLLMVSSEGASTESGDEDVGDVLIEHGQITAIAPSITDVPPGTEVIDAQGQFLGPGLIDLYSQSGEPGHEPRETHDSLRRAALAGGFTRVGLLPSKTNEKKGVTDTVEAIAAITQGNTPGRAQLLPWAAITLGAQGEQLSELAELSAAGAVGLTDGLPIENKALLRRLLEYAEPLKKPIMLWPCDRQIAGNGAAREGADALRLGLAGVSAIAETAALATLIEYIAEIPVPVHIMRVSTARSVALLRQAKSGNLPITASVAWHHLLFDTQDLATYHPSLRHDPPLGTPADKQALITGVAEGVIDAIAIDHSPYTYEEKTVSFDAAPPGAIGLELALPMLWKTFCTASSTVPCTAPSTDCLSPAQLWQMLTSGPAKCIGSQPPSIAIGDTAELTLFNPQASWSATAENLASLSQNTPFADQDIFGKVSRVWC